jgi:phenylacetate-CoA ligase
MIKTFLKNYLGSKEIAEQVAQRAQQVIPAYKHYLKIQGFKPTEPFEQLPQLDKESYILAYSFPELLADDYEQCFAIFRSSGSSGSKFYWPQLNYVGRPSATLLRDFLEKTFYVHQKKTLVIVGLNINGWMGGEILSWVLKSIAIDAPYPFYVFSPGNQPDEIVEIVYKMNPFVDQIILYIVPSALTHLHLKANQAKKLLPIEKLKYMVTGETFPENIRISLQNQAGVGEDTPFMFSMYGSVDTGGLGIESLDTIVLRKLLYKNKPLADSLGIESPIPHFFHFASTETFLETVDNHLCITRWQGIPLVRYILHDQVVLYDWKMLKDSIFTSKHLNSKDEPWLKILAATSDLLPDLLAVSGQADRYLTLDGINFMEYMLDAAVKSEELHPILTGLYQARIFTKNDRNYLVFDLETRDSVYPSEEVVNEVYYTLVQNLGQIQTSFLEAWKNNYSAWDSTHELRVLQLNFQPWPSLSQTTEGSNKHRGIVKF